MQSLAHQFLTFCRSKPADEAYDYIDYQGCAVFQFLESAGFPVHAVTSGHWTDTDRAEHQLPYILRGVLDGGPGLINDLPWNFGALADRLEAALVEGE